MPRPTPSAGVSTTTWSGPGSRGRPATSRRRGASSRPDSPRWPTSRPATTASTCARPWPSTAVVSPSSTFASPSSPVPRGRCSPRWSAGGPCRTAARRSGRRATRSWPTSWPACGSPPRRSGTARRGGRSSTSGVVSARSSGRSGSASGRCTAGGRAERYATLADIQPLLDQQDTAVVAFFVLDHRLGAVTVGGGRPRVVTLGPWAEVAALMTRVRADLDALAGRMLPPPLRQAVSASPGPRPRQAGPAAAAGPAHRRGVAPRHPLAHARHRAVVVAAPPGGPADDGRPLRHRLAPRPDRARSPHRG